MKKYIEIEIEVKPKSINLEKKSGILGKLSRIFFSHKSNEQDNVKHWFLEFEYNDWNYKYEVKREIGLDENKVPILKLPNERNELGYWMDEDVDYDYFKNHFETKEILPEHFLKLWNIVPS